jgi:hypothetical protein
MRVPRGVGEAALSNEAIELTPSEKHFADQDEPESYWFFKRLYPGQTGILECRTFDHPEAWKLRDFVPVIDGVVDMARINRFLAETESRRLGAYFGVALRTPESVRDRKGDAAHCQALTALFVDADYKYLGEAETRRRIQQYRPSPSIVVCSGGGLHVYWTLTAPIDLRTDEQRARRILRRLARSIAGIVDESVSEPARVLRIPGSLNFKKAYGEPRPVVLERV